MVLGLTIAFSPPHLGLLFWLMLGPRGVRRASLLVASWLAISALTIGMLAMVVQGSLGAAVDSAGGINGADHPPR